ncbi:MAG TPA: hypothetical protein VK835_02800 [Bacteroidia bacterium]|jgi:hypothetical protein|nr:hypothetical protein [Bacteroidia bacterium]
MKKTLCLFLFLGLVNTLCFAQNKIFYRETEVEGEVYDLVIVDAVSTPAETKFKIKIINKTASYLSYNPAESKFIINNVEYPVINEKPLIVEPYQTDYKIINLKGPGYNFIKSYTFVAGGIYKLSSNVSTFTGEDFRLPPSSNIATVGPYDITIEKLVKESGKTVAKFSCVYNGEKTGLVHPMKVSVKMPDGKEYATIKRQKTFLLFKGQANDFTLVWERMPGGKANDMQLVDMFVKWNATFNEAEREKTLDASLTLTIDELKTNR